MTDQPTKSKRGVSDLFLTGIYNRGLEENTAAREQILDATYEAYQAGGMSAAKKAFERVADGFAIKRR